MTSTDRQSGYVRAGPERKGLRDCPEHRFAPCPVVLTPTNVQTIYTMTAPAGMSLSLSDKNEEMDPCDIPMTLTPAGLALDAKRCSLAANDGQAIEEQHVLLEAMAAETSDAVCPSGAAATVNDSREAGQRPDAPPARLIRADFDYSPEPKVIDTQARTRTHPVTGDTLESDTVECSPGASRSFDFDDGIDAIEFMIQSFGYPDVRSLREARSGMAPLPMVETPASRDRDADA